MDLACGVWVLTESGQTSGERVFDVRDDGPDDDDGLLQLPGAGDTGGSRDRGRRQRSARVAPLRLLCRTAADVRGRRVFAGVRLVQHGEKLPGRQRSAANHRDGRYGFGHDGRRDENGDGGVRHMCALKCGPEGTGPRRDGGVARRVVGACPVLRVEIRSVGRRWGRCP